MATLTLPGHSQERKFTSTERELEYVVTVWPGEYDNREQLQFAASGNNDSTAPLLRVHSYVNRVHLPSFGEHILYVEEYEDDDEAKLFRQRLYVLSADNEQQAVRVRQHVLKNGASFLGARANQSKLAALRPADTTIVTGCDLLIKRDVDALVGRIQSGNCDRYFNDDRAETDYQVRLTDQQYWFSAPRSSANRADQETPGQVTLWNQTERARRFVCMIDVPREPGGRPIETQHYISIHDQGGTFPFVHPDGRNMMLSMRNYWSNGMRRETFVIAVQKDDLSGPTLVYAWGEPGSDRIGMNPGYLRVQCDLETPDNIVMQQQLRPDS